MLGSSAAASRLQQHAFELQGSCRRAVELFHRLGVATGANLDRLSF